MKTPDADGTAVYTYGCPGAYAYPYPYYGTYYYPSYGYSYPGTSSPRAPLDCRPVEICQCRWSPSGSECAAPI